MIKSEVAACLQTYIDRMAKAKSEYGSFEQIKPFLGELIRDLQQTFGLQLPDILQAVSQIDTSVNIQSADSEIHEKFVLTSKHLCAEVEALQKDIQRGLEDLQSKIDQANQMAQSSIGKSKLRAEQLVEDLKEDVQT